MDFFEPNTLLLTEAAKTQIKTLVSSDAQYLRIGLKGGGCSGFEYAFELVNESNEGDIVVSFDDTGLIIDPISMSYLEGSTVDYKVDLAGAMFSVSSPKAVGTCGCGKSVTF